ncbi:MAG: caspase family protein [Bacteroidales bacterium]|nr:caspase family protein [Bacteroidales bacterium]
MKRSNLLVCAMLMMCQLSLAQVSRDSAYAILKTDILDSTWETKEIFVSKEVLQGEDTVYIGNSFTVIPNFDCWFFFVDEKPFANWSHDCKYVFINKENGNFVIENGNFPPNMITELDLFNSVLPRKATDPKSLFNFPSSKSVSSSNNEYAVIISGGGNQYSNYERYWNDCSAVYKALVNIYNYDKDKIFVIMSDGTSPEPDLNMNYGSIVSSTLDLDYDGTNDIQYAATKANISMVFDTLSQRITSDDNVFIFVTDHGGLNSVIYLWDNDTIGMNDFAQEVNKITNAKSINVCMEQCYSGGYTTALAGNNRVIATACEANNVSYAMPNLVYDEFCFHWISAVSGQTPYGTVINADYNNDNYVSMEEAFQYAQNADTRNENPQYYSPSNPNLGKYLTLKGIPEYDLYTRDNESDNGVEPNFIGNVKNSPDIWLRRSADNGTEHQLGWNGGTNHTYIRINNRGEGSLGTDTVELYTRKAGLGAFFWNSGWTKVGTTCIPSIQAGGSATVRISGTFPNYNRFPLTWDSPDMDYALLTRIKSDIDTMTYNEGLITVLNVYKNNNISFKNITTSSAIILDDDVVTDVVVTALDNPTDGLFRTSLTFTSPANEEGNPLFKEAEIRLIFPKTLVQSWGSSYTLSGAKKINDSTFLVTGSTVKMENISIPANYEGYMMAKVNFLTEEYSEKDKYEYIVEQADPTTGEYQNGLVMIVDKTLRSNLFMAEGGNNVVANANTPANLSATAIGEDAVYNWYNASGVLVNSGQNISVTSSATEKYTLEVIAKADGYKDYDSVYVIRTLGNIVGISPNPTSGHAVVTYNLTSGVSAASIVVTNSSGLPVYNSAINVAATTHTLNLQNLVAGHYSLRLVSSTGEVLDTKTLIVQ